VNSIANAFFRHAALYQFHSRTVRVDARFNRGKTKKVLTRDTFRLVQAHAERVELCPINSGATIRKPARRGLSTFTPLLAHHSCDWRALRGGRDTIREIVVRQGIPEIQSYLLERRMMRS
jgi:hypothetical protein